ncbi:SGNH/GDSL hydrolase family protein [Amycolatopsis roodepoortensis]|uniref:SGNH/GDSL hydrolase family protein n=1 Tax=Amycolatopsis roodepoortensis TaxID=700274 RepID=UPI00214BB33B|nr:SGNH/GDSL hydrolase family protein [Amycolatopsis roodepoortensis]UUV28502.1 SGNH/GDSL hydrolase family protein [Amycolatopsis roodepoortensis]
MISRAVVLAPILLAQAVRVRRTTPRLPGAAGPVTGLVAGEGGPMRLAVLGESTVDGVGAATHAEALTGRLADELARDGGAVAWQAIGKTGANARVAREELLPLLEPADLVVIALGVNDTIELHSAARYRRDLLDLVVAVRRRVGPVPVVLAGVPPMGRFPSLPRPLRDVLGARSAVLDAAAARLALVPGVVHVPMPAAMLDPATFAEDRFHPGPEGYRRWAEQLADVSRRLLSGTFSRQKR